MSLCKMFNPYHFPFSTNVWSRSQDHQQPCLISQMEEIFQISVSLKVVHALHWLMKIPGHVPVIPLITVLNKVLLQVITVACGLAFEMH